MSVPRDFQIFVKPYGSICNLDCNYCYYLKNRNHYPGTDSFRMSTIVLEEYIVQHIEASAQPVISFSWHGGEPTLLGLDYFRQIVSLQRKHLPPGKRIVNGIQTNGMFINDEWCHFLLKEGFGVGLSLDGPRGLHDIYRITKGQKPTHHQAVRGFKLLEKYGIPCDLLCVVHNRNVHYPKKVYRFLRRIGARYIGFLPIVEQNPDTPAGVSSQTVSARAYGRFLCSVFDEWNRRDTKRIMIQNFDEAIRSIRGLEHSLCIFREICGDIPVVEFNGDFYSCDHFVEPKYRIGNFLETPLAELICSEKQLAFGRAKLTHLPSYCLRCEVLDMCNGGCPKDRFIHTPNGEEGLNYLCPGYKKFFNYLRSKYGSVFSDRSNAI